MATRQLPPEISEAFNANPQAARAFQALPAEAQSDWVRWVGRARTRRGRERRVGEMVRRLASYAPAAGAAEETVVEGPPAPPPREWWPWLALLAVLVVAGLLAWFFASRNNDQVTVPHVVGMPVADARAELHARHLVDSVKRVASDRPRDTVVAQDPASGKDVDKGTIVHLNISNAPATVAVPAIVGQDADAAAQQLVSRKLVPDEKGTFSKKPKGTVVSQDPPAGTQVKEGSSVTLVVSHGRGKVAVPAVVGQTAQAAEKTLRKADLVPNVAQVPSSEPAGTVVAQDPKPGTSVTRGSKVRINVSKGGAATTQSTTTTANTTTTATTAGAVAMPNLVGQRFGPALRSLESSGLRTTVVYATSSQPRGTVTAQKPAAGSQVKRGSRVRVTVSAGANPTMQAVPNVTGQDQNAAATALRQAGFTPVVVKRLVSDQSQVGTVVEQQPAAGKQAPRGGSVALYVGSS